MTLHASTTRRIVVGTAVGLTGLLVPLMAAPANAGSSTPAMPSPTYYNTKYSMVSHTKVADYVNTRQRLGSCENPGRTCRITVSSSSTRTFGLSLGASKGFVAGSLNISTASTVGVSTDCSGKTPRGYYLNAYSRGSMHQYKIKRVVTAVYSPYRSTPTARVASPTAGTTISGYLHTFNPYKNAISCRLVHK